MPLLDQLASKRKPVDRYITRKPPSLANRNNSCKVWTQDHWSALFDDR